LGGRRVGLCAGIVASMLALIVSTSAGADANSLAAPVGINLTITGTDAPSGIYRRFYANSDVRVQAEATDPAARLVSLRLRLRYFLTCLNVDTGTFVNRDNQLVAHDSRARGAVLRAELRTSAAALGLGCGVRPSDPHNLHSIYMEVSAEATDSLGGRQVSPPTVLHYGTVTRVATYNLYEGARRDPFLIGAAARLRHADIAFLQEINFKPSPIPPGLVHQAAYLAQRTGMRHWYFKARKTNTFAWPPSNPFFQTGLAILSRYPLINPTFEYVMAPPICPRHADPDANRTVILKARVNIGGIEHLLINSHFNAATCKVNGVDDTQENKIAAALRVAQLIKEFNGPVIFGGDLNAGRPHGNWSPVLLPIVYTPGVVNAESAPLKLVVPEPRPQNQRTCYGMVADGETIDYLFFKAQPYSVLTYDSRCTPQFSDHPIVMAGLG
jgi:endonuclease/exonuclease/phosphatase family metal-dependent hydrolase